ncbi:MAG: hypothetical protein ACOYN8_01190 [Pseudanabaena sp.]|jgi:hypothetical protein
MIHFDRVPEPPDFEREVRQKGEDWLAKHPDNKRLTNLWSPFKKYLADGFLNLCGYSAMFEPIGTVDHYISCDSDRTKAYDWNNYRFASGWLNSSKQNLDDRVFDPFEVQNGWFEVELRTFRLVPQLDKIPNNEWEKAKLTLEKLHLDNDERVVRQRREWYRMYDSGELSLDGLEKKAPLVARAIRKRAD